ncbi:MAG: M3 family oligoendopeptidase [Pseudomonadota bacterium]
MTIQAVSDIDSASNDLPVWELGHLYDGPDSAGLKADLSDAETRAKAFEKRHKGHLGKLTGDELAEAIAEYEAINEILSRLMSFSYLTYAEDMSKGESGRFLQTMQEQVTEISSPLLFFPLELNGLEDLHLDALCDAPSLAQYRPWLRDVRQFRDHQLSDDLERLLHEKQVAGSSAWTRLFDETMAYLRFPISGQDMGSAEALNCLTSADPALRKEAATVIGTVLTENIRLFAHITNTLAKDKQIEDDWRRYAQPWSARNLGNQVEDEVVDALTDSVRASYPRLSHRYYAMKARWFGGDTLDYWDRNAPLPNQPEQSIPWADAQDMVLTAYRAFSPALADVGARFFAERWIDAPVRPGKSPGAFSHPTVPSAHPYILMNYQGKTRDVMTLAHELGHGVHQVLAADQGYLMASTPLTLAETASVFGEMLTFQTLLSNETDPARRKALLAGKVEDMLNTVVRQNAFYLFERAVHTERQKGELSSERLGEIWMEVQRESLGPALVYDDNYSAYWSYIPHFVHSPFYVYAYVFGDCLVNSLYGVFQQAEAGFADRYLDMLRAGGTLRHKELLSPFGLDATDPGFWQRGLSVIEALVDELEQME